MRLHARPAGTESVIVKRLAAFGLSATGEPYGCPTTTTGPRPWKPPGLRSRRCRRRTWRLSVGPWRAYASGDVDEVLAHIDPEGELHPAIIGAWSRERARDRLAHGVGLHRAERQGGKSRGLPESGGHPPKPRGSRSRRCRGRRGTRASSDGVQRIQKGLTAPGVDGSWTTGSSSSTRRGSDGGD
jgi:hypothetical protein